VTCADGKMSNGTNVPSDVSGCHIDKVRSQNMASHSTMLAMIIYITFYMLGEMSYTKCGRGS
jgi:hypothetical protein